MGNITLRPGDFVMTSMGPAMIETVMPDTDTIEVLYDSADGPYTVSDVLPTSWVHKIIND